MESGDHVPGPGNPMPVQETVYNPSDVEFKGDVQGIWYEIDDATAHNDTVIDGVKDWLRGINEKVALMRGNGEEYRAVGPGSHLVDATKFKSYNDMMEFMVKHKEFDGVMYPADALARVADMVADAYAADPADRNPNQAFMDQAFNKGGVLAIDIAKDHPKLLEQIHGVAVDNVELPPTHAQLTPEAAPVAEVPAQQADTLTVRSLIETVAANNHEYFNLKYPHQFEQLVENFVKHTGVDVGQLGANDGEYVIKLAQLGEEVWKDWAEYAKNNNLDPSTAVIPNNGTFSEVREILIEAMRNPNNRQPDGYKLINEAIGQMPSITRLLNRGDAAGAIEQMAQRYKELYPNN